MKKALYLFAAVIFILTGTAYAQVGSPVSINLAIGGGVSMPSGDFSNTYKTGYHGAAKVRIGSLLPLDLVGAVAYHHYADTSGSYAVNLLGISAGVEYPIPSVEIKPYLSAEIALNSLSDNTPNSSTRSRQGVNLGVGAQFMGLDASVKYEMINLMGKQDITVANGTISEPSYNQIVINLSYVFGL
ncbi:MAG: outer membrane beta-barrel protein [Bacteroidota bacterium]